MYRPHSALFLLTLSIAAAGLCRARAQQVPDLSRIVAGMEQVQQQNRARGRGYTITREYRFYGGDQREPKSEVLAEIKFVPPNEKTFTIERSEGNERGQKIVRNILESEVEAARKNPPALDRRGYEFSLMGEDTVEGHPSWILGLKPRRKDQNLVEGRAWVDKKTHQIRRVEGRMARTPSWWLKKVDLRLDFGGSSGVWVPVETRAVVDVRFFGTHILTAEAVKILADKQGAPALLKPGQPTGSEHTPQHRIPSVVGSGVLTSR